VTACRKAIVLAGLVNGDEPASGIFTLNQAINSYKLINQQDHEYFIAAATLTATSPASILLTDNQGIQYNYLAMVTEGSVKKFLADGAVSFDLEPSQYIEETVPLQLRLSDSAVRLFAASPGPISFPAALMVPPSYRSCAIVVPGLPAQMELRQSGSIRITSEQDTAVDTSFATGANPPATHGPGVQLRGGVDRFLNSTIPAGG
jgi:hypothetical protein